MTTFADLLSVVETRNRAIGAPIGKLASAVEHEEWATPYREKVAAIARSEISTINANARSDFARVGTDLARPHQTRIAEGPRLDADALAEVAIVMAEYQSRPRAILGAIDQAFIAGTTRRASILGRAAVALGQLQTDIIGGDDRWDRIADLDPEVRDARMALGMIDRLRLVMEGDIERERAAILHGTRDGLDAEISAKLLGHELGMPPAWAEGEGASAYFQKLGSGR